MTVTPEDSKTISTAIAEFLGAPGRMQALGSKGRSRVLSDFHREKLMEQLAYALNERFAKVPGVR